MIKALNNIEVITLFTEDLPVTKKFYQDVFGLEVVFEDEVSAVVKLQSLMINLLQVSEADELIEPARVAGRDGGSRLLLTILVEDANAVCAELERHGVKLLNGPIDRPWGRRTAAFADPAGNVWEVAQELPGT
ncbi:VOC family protein [Salinispora mooreana]|uniref:VOC family protein n=1 Tax=Salinispora mooreana TaxID=999545 RepID=UPI0003747E29|nr:VOC family protein [Salinispora mooreana]